MINFADIAVILIFVIFCIIGYARGFMRSLTKLMGSFLSLIIAMLLCNSVCTLICLTPLDEWMLDSFYNIFSGLGGSINVLVDGSSQVPILDALTSIGVPGFIAKLMTPALIGLIPAGGSQPVALLLAGYTVQAIMVFSVTVILFIIIRVLIKLLNIFIHFVLKDKLLKFVDRILGFCFGALKSFLCIFIVFALGGYFIEQPYAVVVKEQITSGSLASPLYENNPIQWLWEKYVNFDDILNNLKNAIGLKASEAEGLCFQREESLESQADDTRGFQTEKQEYCLS